MVHWKADENLMDKWDLRFLKLAEEVSTWSKDPSLQVGCVLVNPANLRVTGLGYNGFPRGMCDHEELYADRETKLSRVVHAEVNAVLNSDAADGCTAYVTAPPCCNCALVLIQSGVNRVVCNKPSEKLVERWGEQFEKVKGFFAEVEVEYEEIGPRD